MPFASFDQEGYRVLSPISGYFNKDSLKQVLNICKDAGGFLSALIRMERDQSFSSKWLRHFLNPMFLLPG